ncbi:MAG TPA: Holliday junction resolvase RuvX, partial [Clostridiaceae bacterium]|nr:Holliday junction resolvase RuvX [Clostridiaceae bacterium]
GINTIRRKNLAIDLAELRKICEEYTVESIVLGLPKNMNGTIGPSGEKAIELSRILEEELHVPVKLWDERLTTVAAHKAMIEGDLSRAKRKKIVDKIAAIYILQGYLDRISKR